MAGGLGGLGEWLGSCGCCDRASLPAGCNDAARRRSSLSTSANRPSRGGWARRERHEAHTGLASTGCGSTASCERSSALGASAERGERHAKHNLIWAWGGSGGETSCIAGVACSAGMLDGLDGEEGDGTQDGGGWRWERRREKWRVWEGEATAASGWDSGGGPLLQSPVTCSRGNQPISSVLASRPEPNRTQLLRPQQTYWLRPGPASLFLGHPDTTLHIATATGAAVGDTAQPLRTVKIMSCASERPCARLVADP